MLKYNSLCLVLILSLLTSCSTSTAPKQHNINHDVLQTSDASDVSIQSTADRTKEIVKSMKEVKDIRAVDLNSDLFVAIELKHQYTLRSKKVLGKIRSKLDKEFPTKIIRVTTDHKLYIELNKLEQKIDAKAINKSDLNKRLDQLDKLLKQQI